MGATHLLEREQLVPRSRDEVWAFFADPRNLEALTPDFLRFRIITPSPITMIAGALIDYRLSLFGLPFPWRTRIDEVVEGERFVDVQLRGPYRRWRHLHRFTDAPGGTLVQDSVEYELPLGALGGIAHALFVSHALDRVFEHRRRRVEMLLLPASAPSSGR